MGSQHGVICKQCGHKYSASVGGGFIFHLLHCDQCGTEKAVPFASLGELHSKYLKGLGIPYSVATAESDRHIQESYTGEPIGTLEYHIEVERVAGKCRCGGQYRFDAPPRCPKCRSESHEMDPDGDHALYD